MESAWNQAQARIAELRSLEFPPVPLRTIRVGKLDAELLDQELVQLLQDPVQKSLDAPQWKPELSLILQLLLYRFSMWSTGATYGAKLQDLRYTVPKSLRPLTPSGLPRRTLLIHATFTIIVPYLHSRLRAHALSKAWPDRPSSDRRRKAWDILTSMESTHSMFALLSFVHFLWDGRYRTITDRLLNMRLVPVQRLVKRDVSYEFMNRQMVWHAFTEFLIFLLPLLSGRGMRRRISRVVALLSPTSIASLLSPTRPAEAKTRVTRGKYWALSQDQCAICAENAAYSLNPSEPMNAFTSLAASSIPSSTPESETEPPPHPISTPYVASCGDVYCYHCIAERMMRAADDEQKWECLRCAQAVESADRLTELSGSEMSESEYEFSSDMDVTDLSGSMASMGSYAYTESISSGQ